MNAQLFVYGTLMPGIVGGYGEAARERLLREAAIIGQAKIAGQLYDLGSYPGLVPVADNAAALAHGWLLRLVDPETTFRWLDRYEGIGTKADAREDEYARVERTVTAIDGAAQSLAWVYVYLKDIAPARRIADGRWRA